MDLEDVTDIVYRYEILLEKIKPQLTPPSSYFNTALPYELDSVSIQDGLVRANWSRYVVFGEIDTVSTYHDLSEFFKEKS